MRQWVSCKSTSWTCICSPCAFLYKLPASNGSQKTCTLVLSLRAAANTEAHRNGWSIWDTQWLRILPCLNSSSCVTGWFCDLVHTIQNLEEIRKALWISWISSLPSSLFFMEVFVGLCSTFLINWRFGISSGFISPLQWGGMNNEILPWESVF